MLQQNGGVHETTEEQCVSAATSIEFRTKLQKNKIDYGFKID